MAEKVKTNQAPRKFYDVRPILKELGLDAWLGAEAEEFIRTLNAKVKEGWANLVLPYVRRDGKPVPGLVWSVSVPTKRVNIVFLRLLEVGAGVRVKVRVYANGKGSLEGALAQALIGAWGLEEWSDDAIAALL